jgi:hypothetical protein
MKRRTHPNFLYTIALLFLFFCTPRLNAMKQSDPSEIASTEVFKRLTQNLQRTVARDVFKNGADPALIIQKNLDDAQSAISTLNYVQKHKNNWFKGLVLEDEGLAEECSFPKGTEQFFPEMKGLVDEFVHDESEVTILVIGPCNVVKQIAPNFIFDTFAKKFPDKSVSIFLIDPLYSQYASQEGTVINELFPRILLTTTFLERLSNQINLQVDFNKLQEANRLKTYDNKIVVSENNLITFTQNTAFSKITLKFFATLIPDFYYHSFFNFLRAFFAKKTDSKKIVFIGCVMERNCLDTPAGLAHAYLDFKKLYPDNFFLYSRTSIYDPLEHFKFKLIKKDASRGIVTQQVPLNQTPTAQRFFNITFYDAVVTLKKKLKNLDFPSFIKFMNHKSSFLLYQKIDEPCFTFEGSEGGIIRVSYDGGISSKSSMTDDWKVYIDYRKQAIDFFHTELVNFYKKNNDDATAQAKAKSFFDSFGDAVKPDAEPEEFEKALIFPINYAELI